MDSGDQLIALKGQLAAVVALESAVEESMDQQLKIEFESQTLTSAIKTFLDAIRDSKHRAEAFQKENGDVPGANFLNSASEMFAKASGFVQRARRDDASRLLSENYRAYNDLAMQYAQLYVSAKAFQNDTYGQFAAEGMKTYAHVVQEIFNVLPEAMTYDLRNDQLLNVVDPEFVSGAQADIDRIWKETAS